MYRLKGEFFFENCSANPPSSGYPAGGWVGRSAKFLGRPI